jgi:hypothetical protein
LHASTVKINSPVASQPDEFSLGPCLGRQNRDNRRLSRIAHAAAARSARQRSQLRDHHSNSKSSQAAQDGVIPTHCARDYKPATRARRSGFTAAVGFSRIAIAKYLPVLAQLFENCIVANIIAFSAIGIRKTLPGDNSG